MLCSVCGVNVPEGQTSCANCGSPVTASTAGPPPQVAPPPQIPQPAMPPGPPAAQLPTEGKATASLVLGILSLLCFTILAGIPAVILGHLAQSNIRKSAGRLGGQGMALAGLIMGYVSIVLFVPVVLMMAAIAIPSFLQARYTANQSAAMSTLRTINTAQVTYQTDNTGYARDLATLGPGPAGSCAGRPTAEHACLIDSALGCSSTWCTRQGYRFNITGTECAAAGGCKGYVAVAVPASASTGKRSYCSTQDAVIRYKLDVSLAIPPTADECQSWLSLED